MHIPIQIFFVSAEIRHGWVKISTWKSAKIYRPAKEKGRKLVFIHSTLQQSEDVLFHWSMITATWDNEVAIKLMEMIVELWITVRGFSLASAWIEQYKKVTKKTLQKSKPLRKQIT